MPNQAATTVLFMYFLYTKRWRKMHAKFKPPVRTPNIIHKNIQSTKVNCKMRWIADRWHGLISILNQIPYTEHRIMNFNCFFVRSNSHFHPIVQRRSRFDCKTHGTPFHKLDGHKKRQLISQISSGKSNLYTARLANSIFWIKTLNSKKPQTQGKSPITQEKNSSRVRTK